MSYTLPLLFNHSLTVVLLGPYGAVSSDCLYLVVPPPLAWRSGMGRSIKCGAQDQVLHKARLPLNLVDESVCRLSDALCPSQK